MTKLRVENLSVTIDGNELVSPVSFTLTPGELVIMLGPNGAGKTLTLQHAIGLDRPSGGTATLSGQDTHTMPPMTRAQHLTYLPQTRPLAWPLRVRDLVALGRFAHGTRLGHLSKPDTDAINTALEACDIAHLANRKASTLSGGELARVHCARAFAATTPLLIADEPVAALDPRHQFAIMNLFRAFVDQGGGALIVLHDITLAAKYADRLIWMKDGHLVADGTPADTLTPQRLADIYGVQATLTNGQPHILGPL